MNKRDHQADLDWLYGPGHDRAGESPSSSAPASRPRVETPTYVPVAQPVRPPARSAAAPRKPPAASSRRRPTRQSRNLRQDEWQPPADRRAPKRHPIRSALRLALLALLAWAVFLVAAPAHAISQMSVQQTSGATLLVDQPGTTTLLIGTDSRAELTAEQQNTLGTGDAGGSRADTIMVLYRPPAGRSVLISLPRDSYVVIEGYGEDKLTNAYSYGGPQLLVSTIEQTTGLSIDGYVEIGFGGFAALVDAVGGIEVCLAAPMSDEYAHIDLPAGCQTLAGAQALGYVRMRYSDPLGDLGRARRQREVIGLLVDKIVSPASVVNPVRYWQLTHAGAAMVTRGDDTSIPTLFFSGLALVSVASGDGLSFTVPVATADGWTDQGASVVIWDADQAGQLFAQIASGDTTGMERFIDG